MSTSAPTLTEVACLSVLCAILTACPVSAYNLHTDASALLTLQPLDRRGVLANWSLQTKDYPCDWNFITCAAFGRRPIDRRVTDIRLTHSGLRGPLPWQLSQMDKLMNVDISSQPGPDTHPGEISGSIPEQFAKWRQLRTLNLAGNNLTGTIPPLLLTAPKQLLLIIFNHNQFSGPLPPLEQAVHLQNILLTDNNFSGSIPNAIASLTGLKELMVSRNRLTGTIPESLVACTDITGLQLDGNSFTGKIPPNITKLLQLQTLNLGNNKLTSTIPPGLRGLPRLQTLMLDHNHLQGRIGSFLGAPRLENVLTPLPLPLPLSGSAAPGECADLPSPDGVPESPAAILCVLMHFSLAIANSTHPLTAAAALCGCPAHRHSLMPALLRGLFRCAAHGRLCGGEGVIGGGTQRAMESCPEH
ncbi:hypothetical protein CYMTET_20736 [Cymbomonas tetramitiformis]|uniref:Leucine-rich repeat-containing N-terminal plant-type domain-containing protein n=1 Tax=Cymbomonas tetramitiformis TaxID=36881 RepID=A0AAE0L3K7_9CHLO|nr:hypothetical protein CYMTET_20736 [Cymbomonas tetramitiformis]